MPEQEGRLDTTLAAMRTQDNAQAVTLPGLAPGTRVRYRSDPGGWQALAYRIQRRVLVEDEDGLLLLKYVLLPWVLCGEWLFDDPFLVDAWQVAPWEGEH